MRVAVVATTEEANQCYVSSTHIRMYHCCCRPFLGAGITEPSAVKRLRKTLNRHVVLIVYLRLSNSVKTPLECALFLTTFKLRALAQARQLDSCKRTMCKLRAQCIRIRGDAHHYTYRGTAIGISSAASRERAPSSPLAEMFPLLTELRFPESDLPTNAKGPPREIPHHA